LNNVNYYKSQYLNPKRTNINNKDNE